MKRFYLVAFFLMMVSATLSAKSKVVTDSLYSEVLGCYRAYNVCLPDSWSKDKDRTYPVLYLLHGLGGNNHSWLKNGNIDEIMDYLIGGRTVEEMVVIMPNADADSERAQHGYYNHADWRYEDFFFQELVPHVEGLYRIKAEKKYRAIAGLSMGGGGTVAYAQKHPEMFCAAYAMSAFVSSKGRFSGNNPKNKTEIMRMSQGENDCVEFVKNASDEVKKQLKTVDWYVDCGDDDYLLLINLEFVAEMKKAGIPFEFRVREGGHKWEYWRTALHICLPFVTRAFGN